MVREVQVRADGSPHVPTSFFKIMFPPEDVSRILYLPPKFGRSMSTMVNKEMILTVVTDPSRKQWKVTMSIVNSDFAFEEGWNAFSVAHGLQVGDLLIFNRIDEFHFDVKIYDKSGCERLEFSKNRNKKRSRDTSGSPVRDSGLVRQGPNASVVSKPILKSQNIEVDLGGTQNNTKNTSKYDNNNEREPKVSHVDHGSHAYQNDANGCNRDHPLGEGQLSTGAASDAHEFEFSDRNHSLRGTVKTAFNKASTMKLEENGEHNLMKSNRNVQGCQLSEDLEGDRVVISKGKHALNRDGFHQQMLHGIPNISDAIHNGKMSTKIIRKEHMNRNLGGCSSKGEMSKNIMKEHVNKTPNGCSSKDKVCATGEMSVVKKELVNKNSNGCSFTDKLRATGEMSKNIMKEHVNKTPNGCSSKDTLHATGEMSKAVKKELVDKISNGCSFSDKLCETGEMSKFNKKEPVNNTSNLWSSKDKLCASGEMSKRTKIEHVEMTLDSPSCKDELGATGLSKIIKGKCGQSFVTNNKDNDIQCEVASDNDCFLELPKCLPLSRKGEVKWGRMIVRLRDSQGRLWPVLYNEQRSFQILTAGWLEFRRANKIKPSDVCNFVLESELECIFSVSIEHK